MAFVTPFSGDKRPSIESDFISGRASGNVADQYSNKINKNKIKMENNVNSVPKSKSSKSRGRSGGNTSKTRISQNKGKGSVSVNLDANIKFGGRSNSKSESLFSYDVSGSEVAANYNGGTDHTLFRDWNVTALRPSLTTADDVSSNVVTCEFRNLELGYVAGSTYFDQLLIIYNIWFKDVCEATNNSTSALKTINKDDIIIYLSNVAKAYDKLIQLQVLLGWNPKDHNYYDKSLRSIAVAASETTLISTRNKLREALVPHVLPHKVLTYIKWLRETKLQNSAPESTKLSFKDADTIALMDNLCSGGSVDDYVGVIKGIIQDLHKLNPQIPPVLSSNVESTDFVDVWKYCENVHNSASYDKNWLDIYNNQPTFMSKDGVSVSYPDDNNKRARFVAISQNPPLSLSMSSFASSYLNNTGLPFQSLYQQIKVDGQAVAHTHFYTFYKSKDDTTPSLRGVEHWYEIASDSTHVVDDVNVSALANTKFISRVKGDGVYEIFADSENIEMAQRMALHEMLIDREKY